MIVEQCRAHSDVRSGATPSWMSRGELPHSRTARPRRCFSLYAGPAIRRGPDAAAPQFTVGPTMNGATRTAIFSAHMVDAPDLRLADRSTFYPSSQRAAHLLRYRPTLAAFDVIEACQENRVQPERSKLLGRHTTSLVTRIVPDVRGGERTSGATRALRAFPSLKAIPVRHDDEPQCLPRLLVGLPASGHPGRRGEARSWCLRARA